MLQGESPQPTGLPARITFALVARLITFWYIGPVKTVGRNHARHQGALLMAPNHTFGLDFCVVRTAVPSHFVQVAKAAELKGEVRSFLGAWAGTIAAPVENGSAQKGAGSAVVERCAQYLASDKRSRLLLFPQGRLVKDNVLREEDFRTGAARSLHLASHQFDDVHNLALLPIGIDYKRDPKDARLVQRIVARLAKWIPFLRGFRVWVDVETHADGTKTVTKVTTYGASVVIGEPVPSLSLPQDARACTRVIQDELQKLLDRAQSM